MRNTKEKLMAAAKELFEKNGFAATTTRQISERAGVSEVTLFRHFETKRNLFEQTVHGCLHPYSLKEYFENDAKFDLEHDLKHVAYDMMETYQQNLPMLKMVFKDKMRDSMSKTHLRKHEHEAVGFLFEYFESMHNMGKLKADPKMAQKFFISNITGFFMKDIFTNEGIKKDNEYFAWMIEKVIAVLKG